jgi:HlyD family secretion protein
MASKSSLGWLKSILALLLAALFVGAVAWFFFGRKKDVPQYQTALVTRGDVTQAVTASGQLNPVVNVQVGSQISGRIDKLFVDFNSQVKSNQIIAQIDPSAYKSAVLRASAETANAKANLALAQVQAKRAESLYTNNLISASDHDVALAQAQQAEAQLQSAQAALDNSGIDLSRCEIRAPVDGVVISRNVDVGQTVAASFSTPTLFVIANDLSKMQIDALVSEADIGGVSIGQNVNFTVDAFPYRIFHGELKQIRYGAITNQNVVNYDCVVQVNNDDLKLLPGMTANLSVIIAERKGVLKIPNSALRFKPPEVAASETNKVGSAAAVEKGGTSGGPGAQEGAPGQPARKSGGRDSAAADGAPPRKGEGGPGRSSGAGGGTRPKPDRGGPKTIYKLAEAPTANSPSPKAEPVKIKTGISDGVSTEVSEGIEEGTTVITGLIPTSTAGGSKPSNPFGGGGRRF